MPPHNNQERDYDDCHCYKKSPPDMKSNSTITCAYKISTFSSDFTSKCKVFFDFFFDMFEIPFTLKVSDKLTLSGQFMNISSENVKPNF